MAENLEPINIDINMRQNVSEESDRASRGMDNMTNASKTLKEQIETQRKVIADLEKQYAHAKQSLEDLSNKFSSNHTFSDKEITELTKKYNAAKKLIDEAKSALDGEKTALSQLETELNKVNQAQNKASNSSATYMTQMRKIRQEMQELAMAGKQESTRYRELEVELARVGTAYNRVRAEQRLLTTAGNAHLAGLMQGMTGMAGVFSAGQGAASLFVKNNEKLAAVQTKLQAAMAITIGLQQVSNTLHATSAFRINTVTKVTQLWRNTQVVLNRELGLSLALSKGLMLGGIGLLIAGVVVLISRMKEYNKEQKEFQKLSRDASATIQEQVTKVQILEKVLKDSNRSYSERENALKQLKSIMPEYNAMLDKEGRLIEDNTGALKRYIKELLNVEIAKSAIKKLADAEIAMREFKEGLSDLDKSLLDSPAEGEWIEHNGKKYKTNGDNDRTKRIRKQNDELQSEIDRYTKLAEEYVVADTFVAKDGTKAFYEQKQKNAQALLESMTDLEKGGDKWKAAVKDYNDATAKLKTWDIKGQNRSEESAAKKTEKEADRLKEKQKKANEDLTKKTIEYQTKIDASRIAAMKEGAEKVKAEIQAEYDKEKALIAQELKEIEKLEAITKTPATRQRNQLTQLGAAVTAEYETKIQALDEASEKAIREIFDDVNQKFSSELDNNLAQINKYYDEQIKKAKEAGATISQINLLTSAKQKETILAGLDAKQKEIDFDTEIALRREDMAGKFYLLEADRQMALLKIQEDAARKTLEILRKKYAQSPTKELANDIKAATVALEGFGREEKNLKLQKFRQAADYIAEAAGMLSSLFQDDGAFSNETLEQITSTVGNIAQGFASGGIVGGAIAAAGEAINLVNAAAAAEKRHQEALKVLQQAKIAMQREYLQLLLEEQLQYKNGTSIFGTDTIGKVVNAIDVYRKSIKAYKEELQGDFTPNEAYEKGLEKQAGKGGIMSGYFDKKLNEYRKQLELYNKGTAALYDAEIVTGHKKTGLFGWGKGKDTYSKILDVYDDVFTAEGKLNKQRVQSILDTQKMNDETRNLLQTLLDLEEQAESAQEEMQSLLESTFGSLGDSLATAIVNAFASGDDALMNFKDNVTDVLNGFAKQMIYSQFLSKIFTGLQGDIEDTYNQLADGAITEQDLSNKVTGMLGDFFGGLGGTVDQANQFLEQFWKNAEAAGFDRPESERTGASKGIATASQDSINELNGGIYAIRQQIGDIRNLEKESVAVQRTQQASLDRIAENTEYCRDIPRLIDSIEDMKARGLKMKTS